MALNLSYHRPSPWRPKSGVDQIDHCRNKPKYPASCKSQNKLTCNTRQLKKAIGFWKDPSSVDRITSASQGLTPDFTKSVHGKKWTEPAHPTLKQEWPPSIEWFHSKGSIKNRSTKIYQCEKFHLKNKNNVSALRQFEILIVLVLRRLIWICWFVCVCGAAQVNVSKNAYTGRTHI